nr:ribonuclease H-like domain-containing protein [Tanacetum cinerariifolium]
YLVLLIHEVARPKPNILLRANLGVLHNVMLRDSALVDLKKKFEKVEQERDEFKLKLENFQTSLKNLSQLLASQITDKTILGYDNYVFNSIMFDSDELISSDSDVSMPSSPVYDRVVEGVLQPVAPTTAEQKLARKNELKARGTLLTALPDKHQLKFTSHKDAKTLMEAIEKRFGGNIETKKVQNTLLKQQYENFTVSVATSVSVVCTKMPVSSLPNVDSLSNAVIYSFFASQSTSPQLDKEDLKQINVDDLEEIDLRWQMAMLNMRVRRFLQKTDKNLRDNGPTSMGFDMSKVECYNCHRKGHFARKCRSPKDSRRNGTAKPQRRTVPVKTSTSTKHSQNTNWTNESVNVVTSVYAASTKVLVSALPNVDNLNADDLEEMNLKWQMAMLTMRVRRFLQRTGRNLGANGTTFIVFDMSKVECYNCHKRGHFAMECRSPKDTGIKRLKGDEEPTNYALMAFTSSSSFSFDNEVAPYSKNENVFEEDIKLLKLNVMLRDSALVYLKKKFEKVEQERDEFKLKLENFQTSLKNLIQLLASQITDKTILGYDNHMFNSIMFDSDELISSDSDVSMPSSPVYDRYKSGGGYHAVPPPYTGTFIPPNLIWFFMMLLLLMRLSLLS